eukprot:CAMPEP_0184204298 /NCGR_PEP_ID=MMETSP0976-20121227/9502_1 /TAXON_ID=483370 /ORGANISM="non described non described, Strain CCMP2097" /LENGTH=105 /DNA_ID=CAMNT_0026508887 /DNA_START=249 /DNA_END=566 /DNA_ORIENTATION=+
MYDLFGSSSSAKVRRRFGWSRGVCGITVEIGDRFVNIPPMGVYVVTSNSSAWPGVYMICSLPTVLPANACITNAPTASEVKPIVAMSDVFAPMLPVGFKYTSETT